MRNLSVSEYLDVADYYANLISGCTKVSVGTVIVKNKKIISIGANRAVPDLCKHRGCLRVEKYGDNDKTHRAPSDCRAIHSELDAICKCNEDLTGATIYITRYPCESCARAICAALINKVVYGRSQKISEETQAIFESEGVEVVWLKDWDAPDATN